MANRIGKCTNYASCKLAYQNADIEVENDLVCPECGQPLREAAPVAAPSGAPNKALIFGGIGAGVLILGAGAFFIFKALLHRGGPPITPVVEPATPVPETPSPITPVPITPEPAITPAPVTPKRKPPATPAPPKPETSVPIPATPKPEEEEMPAATAVIDRNPQSDENKNMRAEVLKRIDHIPNLKPSERSGMYVRVNKAKVMMKVITIPFAIGKRTLSQNVAEKLCEATHAPQVQKLVKDPTVVFVVLGFADTIGSADAGLRLSTARADAVTASLRDHCKLLNKMQPVGMGSSEFFGADNKDKNRVVEVWAVIP